LAVTQLLNWLPPEGWPRFAVDAVWQSTLVALVGLFCVHYVAHRPATRALLSLIAMFVAALAPVISATSRSFGWGLLRPTAIAFVPADKAGKSPVVVHEHDTTTKVTDGDAAIHASVNASRLKPVEVSRAIDNRPLTAEHLTPLAPPDGSQPLSTAEVILFLWCAVSGALLSRLCASVWRTRRLLKTASPCHVPQILAALKDAAQRLNVASPPVLLSTAVNSPTVFAFGGGVVVLPQNNQHLNAISAGASPSNSSHFARARWLAVLCHELAHIRRRDGWSRLAAEVVLALLPWQPFFWLFRRDYLRYSEEACDDWAVAAGADPIEFASLLTDLIPTVPRILLGATIMNMDVKTRILRLLSLRETGRPTMGWLPLATIASFACFVLAGVALAQRSTNEPVEDEPKRSVSFANKEDRVSHAPKATVPPMYVLEPPDTVAIEVVKLLPKGALKIDKLDHLEIKATGTLVDHPIRETYVVDEDGEVNFGPEYGRVYVAGLPVKAAIRKIEEHLRKTLEQPKVSLSVVERAIEKHVSGTRLIGPDGYMNLGALGQIHIAGMTIDQARQAIEKHLSQYFDEPSIIVEVLQYNSKVYYVIVEGGGVGDNIFRFPITGNETVLDALTQVDGLSRISKQRIWIARPSAAADGGHKVLHVKIADNMAGAGVETNYQIFPGDRIFVQDAKQLEKRPAGR
jgi:protein involved in polysaccharide export with SLBB domain/beta-lactamase regulating signal transducer with metallopeptidase domain